MKYVSVCSGIEAATVAWHPLGWEPLWFSEVEPFCCSLLAHHYPETPNLGDMTAIEEKTLERFEQPDVLVGGTPCQSFSVAGLRKGMDDPRGNLALRFFQLAGVMRPQWILWENVPGVLSSGKGRDFGSILGAMAEIGYGFAYCIRDAQYFGVPQRRRRVFVVGHLGDWRRAAAVLLERESLCGYSPPSRGAGAGVAGTIDACAERSRGAGINPGMIAATLSSRASYDRGDGSEPLTVTHTLRAEYDASEDGTGRGTPVIPIAFDPGQSDAKKATTQATIDGCPPLIKSRPHAVAYRTSGNCGVMEQGDKTAALNCNTDPTQQIIRQDMAVRRLTPRECERLQGFPDHYTKIPYRKKPTEKCPDGPRYRALGNSMAVPVMNWLGQRIEQVDNLA